MKFNNKTTADLKMLIDRAHQELSALCHGKRFEMNIPARPDEDPDFVIGAGLSAGDELVKRLEAAEAQNILAIAALKQVEWLPLNIEDWIEEHNREPGIHSDGEICPWCGGVQINGHKPGCARQAALEHYRKLVP